MPTVIPDPAAGAEFKAADKFGFERATSIYTPAKHEVPAAPTQPVQQVSGFTIKAEKIPSDSPKDKPEEYSFSSGKLRRYVSELASPSQPPVSGGKPIEQVLGEISLLSVKSGLKRIGVYDAVSRLKCMAAQGRTTVTLQEFTDFVFSHPAHRSTQSYQLAVMRPYLASVFSVFDKESTTAIPLISVFR